MQPNHKITRTNLCVDRLTIGVAMNAARGETQRFNKKIMPSCYVLVHEDWNDSLDRGHVCLPFASSFRPKVEIGDGRPARHSGGSRALAARQRINI